MAKFLRAEQGDFYLFQELELEKLGLIYCVCEC